MTRPTDARAQRRRRLVEALGELRCDAAVIAHLPNVRYLTGFTGSNGILFVSDRQAELFTDPRYELQAEQECDCRVRVVRGPTWEGVWKHVSGRARRLAMEADRLSHDIWTETARRLGKAAKLVAARGLVEKQRRVKSAGEVEAIRASARVCCQAFEETARMLRGEMTERDVAAELDYRMRRLGADGAAFETIVAAGVRAALPHARPGDWRLGTGPVLVDMGACVGGWMSDMTRMVHLGRPRRAFLRLFEAVREAQAAALEAVRAGVPAARVDAAARRRLKERGLARFFPHSTGHGVGLEIHEGPKVGAKSDDVLEACMVVTVEPGVYVAGTGGVRIEDTVLVTESGVEILTPTGKDLLVLSS